MALALTHYKTEPMSCLWKEICCDLKSHSVKKKFDNESSEIIPTLENLNSNYQRSNIISSTISYFVGKNAVGQWMKAAFFEVPSTRNQKCLTASF